jgi:hypothetical protein
MGVIVMHMLWKLSTARAGESERCIERERHVLGITPRFATGGKHGGRTHGLKDPRLAAQTHSPTSPL